MFGILPDFVCTAPAVCVYVVFRDSRRAPLRQVERSNVFQRGLPLQFPRDSRSPPGTLELRVGPKNKAQGAGP